MNILPFKCAQEIKCFFICKKWCFKSFNLIGKKKKNTFTLYVKKNNKKNIKVPLFKLNNSHICKCSSAQLPWCSVPFKILLDLKLHMMFWIYVGWLLCSWTWIDLGKILILWLFRVIFPHLLLVSIYGPGHLSYLLNPQIQGLFGPTPTLDLFFSPPST